MKKNVLPTPTHNLLIASDFSAGKFLINDLIIKRLSIGVGCFIFFSLGRDVAIEHLAFAKIITNIVNVQCSTFNGQCFKTYGFSARNLCFCIPKPMLLIVRTYAIAKKVEIAKLCNLHFFIILSRYYSSKNCQMPFLPMAGFSAPVS